MTERVVIVRESDGIRIEASIGMKGIDCFRGLPTYTPPSPQELREWEAAGWRVEWRDKGDDR